ncbi:MAG: exonuclease domain-containing protein [Micrococcales bacterium]|nr:exonuclease domain-containing protein [Micrococcales bacterium]
MPAKAADAAPTGRTTLFGYGSRTPTGLRLQGPYAAVAIRTNGFTPMRDQVIEIAVVHVNARGDVEETAFASVVEPPGGEAGPTFLHGLEASDLRFAPTFADIARLLLAQLEGRIVVAHHAQFVEQFLAAEFLAAGLLAPTSPTLDLASLSRLTFATANYRLRTLAAHLDLPVTRGGVGALDEARLVAAILPVLLGRLGRELTYPVPLTAVLDFPRGAARPAPRPRPVVPDTLEPWLTHLMTRLSAGAMETNDPRVAVYLDALTDIVSRGRIVAPEAAELARLLARSGYPASAIRTILERFLESLRQAAFEDQRITTTALRHLRAVAVSVGIPTYFDDLIPPPAPPAPRPGSGTFSRPVRKPVAPQPPPRLPRCGYCLVVGHWTANCPRLRGSGGRGAIGPVGAIRPIDPI